MDDSTLAGLNCDSGRRGHRGSQVSLLALALFVVVGATGWLGVHTANVSSSSHGYTLTMEYPRVARAGLDVRFRLTVTHVGGFERPITVALTANYFTIYEAQGWFPDPAHSTRDSSTLYYTFDPPPSGDTFVADFDTYVQPSSQQGEAATVSVLDDGQTAVSVSFTTTLVP